MRGIRLLFVFVSFLSIQAHAATGDCGRERTVVNYEDLVDYEIACAGIARAQELVAKTYGYKTDADIRIEFKQRVLLEFKNEHGELTSTTRVYGMYIGPENRVEMSAFSSDIVQNKEREHFGIRIKELGLPSEQTDALLKHMHLSIVIHELTHLFTQHNFRVPKPGGAVHEYLSYIIQLKSLDPWIREEVLRRNTEEFSHELQINSMIHYFAPHTFGVKSYRHYEKLGERRAQFVDDILSGEFNPDSLFELM